MRQLMNNRAIFLDRDGVINKAMVRDGKPYPPANLSQLAILPKVDEALKLFKQAGFFLVVVTNQPDVARGLTLISEVEAIHAALTARLPIDEIRSCFHDDQDNCDCRKPKPGMLIAAADKWNIDLSKSYMIGDRWRDIAAGVSAGCTTLFIDCGYNEKQPEEYDYQVKNLFETVALIF